MMKTKIVLAALVILLTGCLIPFRVNAQGVRISETGKTDINRISQNGLPDDSQADMEKLKELEDKLHELEEAAGEDGQSVYFTEELADGLAAWINFSWKYELVQTALLCAILGAVMAYAVFDHFMR